MKAELDKTGNLIVSPENTTEEYALSRWFDDFSKLYPLHENIEGLSAGVYISPLVPNAFTACSRPSISVWELDDNRDDEEDDRD